MNILQYQYPIDTEWSTNEIIDVINFFQTVEKAYESKVEAKQVMNAYRKFKEVVPSKAEEKTLFNQFEKQSSYVPYQVVKLAKDSDASRQIHLSK
ncbi:UPF0223 family protein [Bacillaceae bacterium W0354]